MHVYLSSVFSRPFGRPLSCNALFPLPLYSATYHKMVVSFGSVGDIIALGILIKDLIKCLDNGRGASAEFQTMIRELRSLEYALVEVQFLFLPEPRQELQSLEPLRNSVLVVAAQLDKCITEYSSRLRRYQNNLQPGGSANFAKDVALKVKWGLSDKESFPKFQDEIVAHCLSINTLVASTGL